MIKWTSNPNLWSSGGFLLQWEKSRSGFDKQVLRILLDESLDSKLERKLICILST